MTDKLYNWMEEAFFSDAARKRADKLCLGLVIFSVVYLTWEVLR